MNKTFIYILLFFIPFLFTTCEKLLIKEGDVNTPENNFEIVWKKFDENYAYFTINQINWDSVYQVYRPKVDENTSFNQLLSIFYEMTLILKDGHVILYNKNQTFSYNFEEDYPYNAYSYVRISDLFKWHKEFGDVFEYGLFQDNSIGYIRIKQFFSSNNDEFEKIDQILKELENAEAMILDIRSNGGGSGDNSFTVASRFCDSPHIAFYTKQKTGKGHDNFSEWITHVIEPDGKTQFTKNIAILTNRGTYSAAETFVLLMKSMPYVTIIGGNTGGAGGAPMFYSLPNGINIKLTSTIDVDNQFNYSQGSGIYPDIEINNLDSISSNDEIVNYAITYLQERIED